MLDRFRDGNTGAFTAISKNFRIPHPMEPTKDIVYACIEGPEVAAYIRGTAKLVNGEAHVEYQDHFKIVVNWETVTIQLTPLSADSKGLALLDKNANGFRIKELFNGTGNYKFDFLVQGIRRGYEDHKAIQDKLNPDLLNN